LSKFVSKNDLEVYQDKPKSDVLTHVWKGHSNNNYNGWRKVNVDKKRNSVLFYPSGNNMY